MDRMTSMATFVKVVESGGFSAAARTLGMSPSMVTAHVQSLEERLGVRLLNRSTRRVSLTEVGHAYYERCSQVLADVEDADQIAQALQSTPRGTLRLNTSIAIPPLLAPVITEFVALYPEVSINLTMTDRMIDLVEEGFDLAVRNMPVPDSSLVVRRVATSVRRGRGAELSRRAGNAEATGRSRASQLSGLLPFGMGQRMALRRGERRAIGHCAGQFASQQR
jgi:DNA-binding transcriptional LysR family regulator